MVFDTIAILMIVGGAVVGFTGGFIYRKFAGGKRLKSASAQADAIIAEATAKAKTLSKESELEIRDRELKARSALEIEMREKQKELTKMEKRLMGREENLDKKFDSIEQREMEAKKQEQSLIDKRKHADSLEKKYNDLVLDARKALENVAGISAEEAKRRLNESLISDAKHEAATQIKTIVDGAKEEADKQAIYIISSAIERLSNETVAERSVSVVHLPSDEMKGRIIGREGRNIRALEAATGIDIIIDDTPEAVVLSGFNPIRREVARRTLEKLIQDGRIHPTRIEEMVAKMTKEVNAAIKEAGEQAVYEAGLHNIHPELIKLLGSLKFRYSYAQNVLMHSKEVCHLAGMMAAELGLNQKKAKRAGLLHDIGKAVSHEVEGSHALIGMDYCKKYREDADICHAIGAHHEDLPQESSLDCIVDAADALSGARPGTRREVLETYVKRLEDLERISTSFAGVEKAYAIQAGREIRVMVDNSTVNDADAAILSKDIANKIETEMTYPGLIKVTVIRETRATEFAK